MKRAALELGLPLWQPETLRGAAALTQLRSLEPDCVVVAAYGEIIRPRMLAAGARGFVNVHASLLPRYRGASPISAAILAGDARGRASPSCCSTPAWTRGRSWRRSAIPIAADATRGSPGGGPGRRSAPGCWRRRPAGLAGRPHRPQRRRTRASPPCTRPIEREDGRIDWAAPAGRDRAALPGHGPVAGRLHLLGGQAAEDHPRRRGTGRGRRPPGTVLSPIGGGVAVACGSGSLRLLRLQPEGRGPMSADDFARGRPQFIGAD